MRPRQKNPIKSTVSTPKRAGKSPETEQTVRTKTDLADRLNMSRTTLDRYLKIDGAPSRGKDGYNLTAVSDWVARHAHTVALAAKVDPELVRLKIEEARLRRDRLRQQLERETGNLIPRADLDDWSGMLLRQLRFKLQGILEVSAIPRIKECGSDGVAIHIAMRGFVDEICRFLMEELRKYQEQNPGRWSRR